MLLRGGRHLRLDFDPAHEIHFTLTMPKFKFRLGSQPFLTLSGKRYRSGFQLDTFNCQLSLRYGSLQASGKGNFTSSDLQLFVNSLVEIVRSLRGECELTPSAGGTFSIRVAVANTGKLVTDVKIATLTSEALDAVGWSTHVRFHTPWDEYYHPVDVDCLNVKSLKGLAHHTPSVESP